MLANQDGRDVTQPVAFSSMSRAAIFSCWRAAAAAARFASFSRHAVSREPVSRAIQAVGRIFGRPVLGGLPSQIYMDLIYDRHSDVDMRKCHEKK
jgi:hypothetical protein